MNLHQPTPTSRPELWFRAAMLLLLPLSACSDNPAGANGNGREVTDTVATRPAVDHGEVGVVVDARAILKKGYIARTVAIQFPNHARFNATLDLDAVTSLAILRIHNDSLTAAEKAAFANGVAAHVVVYDAAGGELAERDETDLVLDDSGVPFGIETAMPLIQQPLALREGVPYLLQPENEDGVLNYNSVCGVVPNCWTVGNYVSGDWHQQFRLTAVPGAPDDNTYSVGLAFPPNGETWSWWIERYPPYPTSVGVVGSVSAGAFVLEQDGDGWVRIRIAGTQDYLVRVQDGFEEYLAPSSTAADRFRLITDDIDWTVTDRGTVYHQPIVPPARLDFAYAATIKNCSPASVTETIGRTESRTQTTTISTTESLQLFAGYSLKLGVKIGVAVEAGVIAAKVSGSAELSADHTLTTNLTRVEASTLTHVASKSSEVSRTRSIAVPPFTAIEAYDAVRTIENFQIPFTQVYRFSGRYKNGAALSGSEILSYMVLNMVEGVPTAVGAQHVDIGIRGAARVDQMFEGETQVKELVGGCN